MMLTTLLISLTSTVPSPVTSPLTCAITLKPHSITAAAVMILKYLFIVIRFMITIGKGSVFFFILQLDAWQLVHSGVFLS
jgi:hypothetical protein